MAQSTGKNGHVRSSRLLTLVGSVALFVSLLIAWGAQARQPRPIVLTPTLTGEREYCLTCHNDLPQISASHPIKTFGCVICHGGERLALDADLAHSTMRGGANPSDLTVVQQSCGGEQCHSGSAADSRDHIQRVMTSVQATYSGAIASVLYTFGAQPDLVARYGMDAITDDPVTTSTGVKGLQLFNPALEENPFVQKFASNCTTCHINAKPAQGAEYARLPGCSACHTAALQSARGVRWGLLGHQNLATTRPGRPLRPPRIKRRHRQPWR